MIKRGDKKSQITVFIIIGIILLFTVGAFLYVRQVSIERGGYFAPKVAPVEKFVSQCTERVTRDALEILGRQGGYIELPREIALNPSIHILTIPNAPVRYLDLVPRVPFWYFNGQSRIPSLLSIQRDLEGYVNSHMQDCLQHFTDFKHEFNITEHTQPEAHIVFQDQGIVVQLNYEIDILKKGTDELTRKKEFIIELPVRFKYLYELANSILEQENLNSWFEKITIDLMALHKDKDIPFTGTDFFQCSPKMWFTPEIKSKLQNVLVPSLDSIRFKGTDYLPFASDNFKDYEKFRNISLDDAIRGKLPSGKPPWDAYEYFHYFLDPKTGNKFKNLIASVAYNPVWGMTLSARPSQGGLLKTTPRDMRSTVLSMLCIQIYHFAYDIRYPIMVTLRDPDAFRGEGYNFQYAFPVQIYHNAPDRSAKPATFIDPDFFESNICDTFGDKHKIVRVNNGFYDEPGGIGGVNLSYNCFDFTCSLGETRSNRGEYSWDGYLPDACSRGFVIAQKEGYLTTKQQIGPGEKFEMDMYPMKKFDIDVKKHRIFNVEKGTSIPRKLAADEYVILTIETINNDPTEFSKFMKIDSRTLDARNATLNLFEAGTTYYLNAILFKQTGGEQVISGGWEGNWTPDVSELVNSEKLTFNILEQTPAPTNSAQTMEIMTMLMNRSRYENINPEFTTISGGKIEEFDN